MIVSNASQTSKPIAVVTRTSNQGDRADERLRTHPMQRKAIESALKNWRNPDGTMGLPIVSKRFEDTDKSGGKMSRPAFDEAMEGLFSGKYGGAAFDTLDRFARTFKEALDYIDRIEKEAPDAKLIILDAPFDTSTAMGRAMLRTALTWSTFYREQGAEKVKKTLSLNRSERKSTGGRPPLGFRWEGRGLDSNDTELHGWLVPAECFEVVKDIRLRAANGSLKTAYAVAAALNDAGLRTSHGNTWNPRTAQGFLVRDGYCGTWQGVEVEQMHDAGVQRVIERKFSTKKAEGRKTYVRGEGHVLGEGLCKCSFCGWSMVESGKGKAPTLRCGSGLAGHSSITYSHAQAWIERFAFSSWAHDIENYDGVVKALRSRSTLVKNRDDAQAAYDDLKALMGGVEPPAASAQAQALAFAQDALLSYDIEEGNDDGPTIITAEEYETLGTAGKRAALHALVSEVVVLPGKQGQRIAGRDLHDRLVIRFHGSANVIGGQPTLVPSVDGPVEAPVVGSEAVAV